MRNLILSLICCFAFSVHAAESGVAPASPATGYVTIQSPIGTTLQGYVAGPENSRFGMLILHDRWGINDTIRQWVDRFAAKGYRVLAIDVFDGRISDKMWLATEILNATDPEAVKADVKAGLNYLKQAGRKVVTLGAGFGGWQSFQAAIEAPDDVAGTIVIYGELQANVKQARALKAPLLAVFARDDERISSAMIEEYRLLIKKSLISYSSYTVPADFGFMEPGYASYNPSFVNDVWIQVDSFLRTFIESGQG